MTLSPAVPSPLARALARGFRLFAKVEPGEAATAAAMMLSAFLLLSAYYLLKTVREPLILLEGGADVKIYARGAQAVLMVGVVQVYGEIAKRVGRKKLLGIVFGFFLSNLVVFAILARTTVPIGIVFYLWVGLFSYTSVAQFWALAADIYSEDQGKRLFPVIGIGSSGGALAGSLLAKTLVHHGSFALMAGAVVLLVPCMGALALVERGSGAVVDGPSKGSKKGKGEPAREEPLSDEGALHLLLRDRYLLLIVALIVLLNWCNSAGEYIFDRTILAEVDAARARGIAPGAFVGSIKADYFLWYNLLGMVLQSFAVSRILAKLGVRNALLFLPVFALVGYSWAAFVPVMAVIRLVKIGENALEYSVAETSKHALYLVASRVEKYVGKTAVDTIAVRVGAILTSVVVWIGGRVGLPLWGFALINVVLAAAWIAVVIAIGHEHARRAGEDEVQLAAEPATP